MGGVRQSFRPHHFALRVRDNSVVRSNFSEWIRDWRHRSAQCVRQSFRWLREVHSAGQTQSEGRVRQSFRPGGERVRPNDLSSMNGVDIGDINRVRQSFRPGGERVWPIGPFSERAEQILATSMDETSSAIAGADTAREIESVNPFVLMLGEVHSALSEDTAWGSSPPILSSWGCTAYRRPCMAMFEQQMALYWTF